MSTPRNILAFECASGGCSAAVMKGGEIVAEERIEERNAQTRQLLPLLRDLCAQASLDFPMLDGIATTSGPGSFTGIRIGLSTALGLAYAAAKPLYTLNNLELLAFQQWEISPDADIPILSLINAYRKEVYLQQFSTKDGFAAATKAQLIRQEDLAKHLPEASYMIAGDAHELLNALGINAPAPHAATIHPSAAALARYLAKLPCMPTALDQIAPFYLRQADAKKQNAVEKLKKAKL